VPSPANPQSLNRYAYTLNNPLRYTDPSGHSVLGALAIAGAIGFVADVTWQVYSNIANDNMAFTDALMSVDLAEAGGAAVGAVVAAGTTMLAVAAVPIAVTGLGLTGGAASAATVGLTSLAYSGSSVVGAIATDSTAAGLRGEEYQVGNLSRYRTNALVGGLIGFAVAGTDQITSIANAGVEASAREFDRTFGIVWDSYPNHNLADWSDPFVFETHIRPTLLGQVRPPSIPGLTFLQGISSSPILTSDDIWCTGVEIIRNERRLR